MAAALTWCAAARADDSDFGTLFTSDSAIIKLLRGNTLQGTLEQTGAPWAEFYCDTGKSLYDFEQIIALGKWWVEHDQVCFAYDWSDYRRVNCFNLYAKPDGSLTFDGKGEGDVPVLTFRSGPPVPGDPNHLAQRAARGCLPEPSD